MAAADVKTIVLVRVTINDSLFVLCAVSLSVCLYKVAKMSLANIYLESKVTTSLLGTGLKQEDSAHFHHITSITSVCRGRRCVRWPWSASPWCCCTRRGPVTTWWCSPSPTSRTSTPSTTTGTTSQTRWVFFFRLHTFCPCWHWVLKLQIYFGTPYLWPLQADLRSSLGDGGYVVFGVILFVWELLPTSLVVFFFRVRRPPQERVSPFRWVMWLWPQLSLSMFDPYFLPPSWESKSYCKWRPSFTKHIWDSCLWLECKHWVHVASLTCSSLSLVSYSFEHLFMVLTEWYSLFTERRRDTEPRPLLQRIFLWQPSSVRQWRRPGVEHPSPEHFSKVPKTASCRGNQLNESNNPASNSKVVTIAFSTETEEIKWINSHKIHVFRKGCQFFFVTFFHFCNFMQINWPAL